MPMQHYPMRREDWAALRRYQFSPLEIHRLLFTRDRHGGPRFDRSATYFQVVPPPPLGSIDDEYIRAHLPRGWEPYPAGDDEQGSTDDE